MAAKRSEGFKEKVSIELERGDWVVIATLMEGMLAGMFGPMPETSTMRPLLEKILKEASIPLPSSVLRPLDVQ